MIKLILADNTEFEVFRVNYRINLGGNKEEVCDIEFANPIKNIKEVFNKISGAEFRIVKNDEVILTDADITPEGIHRDITAERDDCHMTFKVVN